MNSFLNIQVRIIAQQAMAQIKQLKGQLGGLGTDSIGNTSRLDRLGSQMQWLGRQIEYNFTVPILAAGGAATKMALDTETAFVRITKVYGDAAHGADFYAAELNSLKGAFVALSNEFGVTQQDTLNIAADWAAAGASGLALAKSVELTMKTMVLGEMDAASSTQSLIAIQAQYGLSISQLSDTIDILNMVENQTGISMKGLIDGFARTAGVARASGVSVRELAADLAALTPATGSAANAGNALKTIFSRLLSPTKDTSTILGLMGINVKSLAWESSNAQEKLLLMAGSFNKLSDAQKGLVSSIIASRYQVNRFEVLMRELTSSTGYYQRSLESTANMNDVYKQSVKELNQVLTSNPQRLKVIWTMLQNALINIIQPLIPAILWFASAVENAVTAFSHLDPGLQKFILLGLGMLAVIGPLVRYLGAIQVLLFELTGLFKFAIVPLDVLGFLFKYIIGLPVQLFFTGLGIALRGMTVTAISAATVMGPVFDAMMAGIQVAITAGSVIVRDIWTIWLASLGSLTRFFSAIILGIWNVMWFLVEESTLGAWRLITGAWVAGTAALERVLLAFAAFSGRVWRITAAAPLVVLQAMWSSIIAGFAGFLPFLRTVGIAVFDALTGPWGIAITAIILVVMLFWRQIKQIWTNAVNFFRNGAGVADAFAPLGRAAVAVKDLVLRAFNALPAGIRSALIAVVDTVAAAARAVYHWFSYLNPWAKHSPSLVDNVKTGSAAIQGHYGDTHAAAMQAKDTAASVTASHAAATTGHADAVQSAVSTIKTQYSELTSVSSSFAKATDDVDAFAKAVASVERAAEQLHFDDIRKQLQELAPAAVGAFDQLVKDLYPLEDQLKVVQKALDAQQAVVDAWKQKLDDANATLQTQKDVLDSMKNSVDDFTSRVNAINGDLEILSGTREALRQAGAGSDILKGYDDQINKLRDQKKGLNDQLSAAEKSYNAQKQYVDELTAARDKLQASYDEEQKKLKDIQSQYDGIKNQIDAITGAINDFASAADALQAAKKGKNDFLGSNFAAGAGANFPDVGGTGMLGREGGIGDQSALIDQFTKDIQDKTKNLFGLFNFLDPIKKGWNAAWNWIKTTFGPIGSLIANFFSHLFDGIGNPLKGLDFSGWVAALKSVGEGVFGFFKSIWDLIGPPIKEIGHILMDSLYRAFQQISPELKKFKDLVKPLGDLWKEIAPILKVVGAILGGILLLALNIIISVLKEALGPILNWIIDIIKAVIQIFRGLIEFLVGVFTGNWKLAWQGIKDFFGGIWDAIWSTIKNAGLLIWGIVKGIVEGIWNFFKWVYDELVGHSIIPDIVNGVVAWFNILKDAAIAIWNAFMAGLKWIWENILKPVFTAIVDAFKLMLEGIKIVIGWVKAQWDLFISYIRAAWDAGRVIIGWIHDKFYDIINGVKDVVGQVRAKIDEFLGVVTGIKNRMSGIFTGIFDGIKDAFKSAINWVVGKWNSLNFSAAGFTIGLPRLPYLAKGGLVANEAMAIVGEGRKGYPEYVIPTDPQYRNRALGLFVELSQQLGLKGYLGSMAALKHLGTGTFHKGDRVQFLASGGILGRASLRASGSAGSIIVVAAPTTNAEYHFHGDLSFPNIRDGKDAEEFVKNLEALVG